MSDKVKQMTNKVVLTGKVTEFEKRVGTISSGESKGAPYISFKGKIQFGEIGRASCRERVCVPV